MKIMHYGTIYDRILRGVMDGKALGISCFDWDNGFIAISTGSSAFWD